MFQFDRDAYQRRVRWFTEARFGMFIHWGLYAIHGRGEWMRSNERIPKQPYMRYFEEFSAPQCDIGQWVKAARRAGMRYVVLTAKHHDGFCLWDTATTDFKSTNTPAARDFVREFTAACRSEGLRCGLYYSLLDWYHEDYPHYGDLHHPMRGEESHSNEKRDFSRYIAYMHRQVEELCTGYGKLDILWFDFSYPGMRGEAWEAERLMEMVRRYQPDVVIDNRLEVSGEGFGSLAEGKPSAYHGDFVSPEQMIPPGGVVGKNGEPLVWEACVTMNGSWGYTAHDRLFKPAPLLVKKLVECVSKGGNLLLNIGPDARGVIPAPSLAALEALGEWMDKNGESIYGCGAAGLEKPEYGRFTRCGDTLYYHVMENTVGALPLFGIGKEDILEVRRLCDGCEMPLSTHWNHSDYPGLAFVDMGPNPALPDTSDTVLALRLRPGALPAAR